MSKKIVFGMIALLSVSLFFLGCPTEASDDGDNAPSTLPDTPSTPNTPSSPSPPTPAQAAKSLADSLEDILPTTAVVTTAGDTVTITSSVDLTIEEPVNIPAGVTLEGTLALDKNLTVTERVVVAPGATLKVGTSGAGALSLNNADVTVYGTFIIENGTTGSATEGTVTIESGGKIISGVGVAISGGETIVKAGGTAVVNGVTTHPLVGTDSSAQFNLTSGTFTYSDTIGYELGGEATINNTSEDVAVDIHFGKLGGGTAAFLKIKGGAVLTIATDATVKLWDAVSAGTIPVEGDPAVTGTAASKIVVQATANIEYDSGASYKYFYPVADTAVGEGYYHSNTSGPIPTGTYEWRTHASTPDTGGAGWKLTS
jgi:hypothetical protein